MHYAEHLFRKIFFDKGKNKVKMWLVKCNVSFNQLDEVESNMHLVFVNCLRTYNHDKIPFEKYCWTAFRQELLNFFTSKKYKKNGNVSFEDLVKKNGDGDYDTSELDVHLGVISDNVYELDFETVFMEMDQLSSFICRCIYYSDMDKQDVIEYLGISRNKFNQEVLKIRKVFSKYLQEQI